MREQQLAKTFDDVICKSLLPDEATVEGMVFRPLRTLRRLREEGIEMRHCVAAYAPMVKHGQCAIVAVKRQGVGIATMELDRSGRIVQLKGHCNQAPSTETRRACDLYVLLYWRNPDEQAAEQAA
nr:PcfJ domain-containing protein [Sphingomonas yantingensis]